MALPYPDSPILIADDDSDDAFILQHRLKKAGIANPVLLFGDGEELVDLLVQWPLNRARPCVLLLDLKMPRMDGCDVLQWLATSSMKGLPSVVISSSTRMEDRARATQSGATEFHEKFPSEPELARIVLRASQHPFATRQPPPP